MTAEEAALPAILGGWPSVSLDKGDTFKWPIITAEDEEAVLRVMRDGDLSTHSVSRALEADYCAYFGRRFAISHCNGTAALHAAFFALGLSPGDEILVPSATWWASVVPMLWLGLVPVFCESEPERCGLDPADMLKKITRKTRALVVVHLWGLPSKMTEIFEIARQHNLSIVEDASHAHGATWRGRKCGSFGDVSVFSLQSHKLAPAGEGGMLLTDREDIAERTALFGDVVRIWELATPARRFAATSFGVKTRMAPMSAAIGRVQLKKLEQNNAVRNAHMISLSLHLEELGFHTFRPPEHIQRVYFEFLFYPTTKSGVTDIDLLIRALQAEGVDAHRTRYPLVHQQPLFTEGLFAEIARLPSCQLPSYAPQALPFTEAFNEKLIRLPIFVRSNPPLLEQYKNAFTKVMTSWSAIAARAENQARGD